MTIVFLFDNIYYASRKYKPSVLQKRRLHFILVGVHECNLHLEKQRFHQLLGWADRTVYIRRPASNFGSRKKADF